MDRQSGQTEWTDRLDGPSGRTASALARRRDAHAGRVRAVPAASFSPFRATKISPIESSTVSSSVPACGTVASPPDSWVCAKWKTMCGNAATALAAAAAYTGSGLSFTIA